jgi:hypothetical protein
MFKTDNIKPFNILSSKIENKSMEETDEIGSNLDEDFKFIEEQSEITVLNNQ